MMSPRKILLLDTGKEWGGGTNSMFELLRRIDKQSFSVTPLFYDNYRRGDSGDLRGAFAEIGLELQILPRRQQPLWAKLLKELVRGFLSWAPSVRRQCLFAIEKVWRIRPDARRLAAYLRDGGYDLLYLNNQPSSNLEGLLAAEMAGTPVVQHCRIEADLNVEEVTILNRVVQKVICVSSGVKETLVAQGVMAEKCSVVLNGVDGSLPLPDKSVARQSLGWQANRVVGTIGSLVPRKGILPLMAAFARLKREDVHLLVVGEGPQREALEAAARSQAITHQTHLVGFHKDPLPFLAAMDIFCLVSAREGLPRVVLEAMLLGKPVIATDIPGTRELVHHEETGLLVPYGDEPALLAALEKLIADPALADAMGQRGREVVLAQYSIETYVHGVESVLKAHAR